MRISIQRFFTTLFMIVLALTLCAAPVCAHKLGGGTESKIESYLPHVVGGADLYQDGPPLVGVVIPATHQGVIADANSKYEIHFLNNKTESVMFCARTIIAVDDGER